MAAVAGKPPVTELSVAEPNGVPSWGALGFSAFGGPGTRVARDSREYVRELRWPYSVRQTFPRMATDSQLKALERGTVLPITRYAWGIDPNGADQALVDRVCAAYGLDLIDDAIEERRNGRPGRPVQRARNRFSFNRHLGEAVKMIRNGHELFEQVGFVGDDGLWQPTKLAEIPVRSIEKFIVDDDGGLMAVKQVGLQRPPIPISQIVAYVWDEAERGDWFGTSMYRACYREWLIKDRLLRVDATNHEKAGGVLMPTAPEGATAAEKEKLAEAAQQFAVGGGGALPAGTGLNFIRATGSDVIGSINRHDEAMARAWLLMAIQLGSTQTGARAVGAVQQELWSYFQEAIAIVIRDVFNEHVIEDYVDWNFGESVDLVPRLVFVPPEQTQKPLQTGGAVIDPVTQALIDGASPSQVAAARIAYAGENRRYRQKLAKILPYLLTDEELAAVGDVVEEDDEIGEQLQLAFEEGRVKPTRGRKAPRLSLPDRPLRREPTDAEVRAAVDFKQLDDHWQSAVDKLVADWQTIRTSQIAELVKQIAAANGDLSTLTALAASVAGGDLLAEQLTAMAHTGVAEATAEAKAQGVASPATPALEQLETELAARSDALAQLLAQSLSQAAATKAVQISGGALTTGEVAAQVKTYLDGLTDSYLADQFGGALSAAQNAGRLAAMDENQASRYYASELLDTNTCDPCEQVDGTEYETADAAASDYPAGGYRECAGGPRCRGTVVAVYAESEPSA